VGFAGFPKNFADHVRSFHTMTDQRLFEHVRRFLVILYNVSPLLPECTVSPGVCLPNCAFGLHGEGVLGA